MNDTKTGKAFHDILSGSSDYMVQQLDDSNVVSAQYDIGRAATITFATDPKHVQEMVLPFPASHLGFVVWIPTKDVPDWAFKSGD